ncbi:aminopeptidase N [Candidatus Endobugula sertula]|uniref:Aminopeptidase N n=1 Tax=Candidatus Endobugula sertula TaxID=62101 RepID=A0A1D2QQK4_9GAMM|nr:aminopeptidase N [Candidatus Endobugula sertula]
MKNTQLQEIRLVDYQVPDFFIEKTGLEFNLEESLTTVTATLQIKKNPQSEVANAPLILHGQELVLRSVFIDDRELEDSEYQVDDESLTLIIPDECTVRCVTEIKPQENTSLAGLYKSRAMYCTQCEAEGFRKITYYLDRPDVMSEFTTKITASKERYPVLLSNGNLINKGELNNQRHWAEWHDPFKKPAYLFALVAGRLEYIEDQFTTMSGRKVTLRIYVESKELDKCDHAMQSLKHAMAWDEKVYGREYDLDIFMIVAVDDFNMGAMENKGLNVFNTSCVLANPETTTDAGFQQVEGVVAHEYFHNWSGNRVTCRDWFQLSLKEGFTVFRDAEFSSDAGSRAVKRVKDVIALRTLQFAEDAGPMAHPVQPPSFIEISNFYTVTIYEKGAEIVRMLHTLLGAKQFREGSDLYFQRHDGQAVTINEFVNAMETVSGRDLTQFKHWYTQAGTPVLTVTDHYDGESQRYWLTVKQHCPDTPEATSAEKQAYHLPLAMGLVGVNGCLSVSMDEGKSHHSHQVLEITKAEQTFSFSDVKEKPVPSLLRNFSAPVRLNVERSREDYLRLLCHDEDDFSRWDATQQLAVSILDDVILAYQQQQTITIDPSLQQGIKTILADNSLDKAMVSLLLRLPSEAYLSEIAPVVDVDAIHFARQQLALSLAEGLKDELMACYQLLNLNEPYQTTADEIAKRSLKNTALYYLMLLDDRAIVEQCLAQFSAANNMTDRMAAFEAIVHSQQPTANAYKETVLEKFYCQWQHEALVVNQWLMVQASIPSTDTLAKVKVLMDHPCFSIKNPNKVRSLISTFARNMLAFHQASGEGYQFLAEQVVALNVINPQIAAHIVTPLTRWKKYDKPRQQLMRQTLENIYSTTGLSKDVYEVVSKSL